VALVVRAAGLAVAVLARVDPVVEVAEAVEE
jgi:hypothetical protein